MSLTLLVQDWWRLNTVETEQIGRILADGISDAFSRNEMNVFIQVSPKFIPIVKYSTLAQAVIWCHQTTYHCKDSWGHVVALGFNKLAVQLILSSILVL